MGIGDELMRAGEALRRANGTSKRFRMLDKRGMPVWHDIWLKHPNIAKLSQPYDDQLGWTNGKRDYLLDIQPERYTFKEYQPHPAPIWLPPASRALSERTRGAVVFNPTIKPRASPNKAWPMQRWQALIELCPEIRWVQLGDPSNAPLRGVQFLSTASFLDACGLLAGARAAVLHEGALHHAAAAFRIPAVVIRGGFIGPRVTGYDGQVDLFHETPQYPLGCGWRIPCPHCDAAMKSITPEAVAAALRSILQNEEALA